MSAVSKQILAALIAGLSLAQPISGQDKAVSIAVRGGGFNSVTELDDAGTADFKKTGYSANASIGVDLHRYVALRGDLGVARNEFQQNGIETGRDLTRLFYDAAVQVQYDAASGLKPYAFVGAGGVTLHPVGTSDSDKSKFAGTVGLGLNYRLPGSNLGVLVEGKGWLYELSGLNGSLAGFEKTQFDVTWSAGLSYRIPFASSAAR